jgi:hypothetical protein
MIEQFILRVKLALTLLDVIKQVKQQSAAESFFS